MGAHTAAHYTTLQHCNTLQRKLQHAATRSITHRKTLAGHVANAAIHCNTLQHAATHTARHWLDPTQKPTI